MSKIRYIVGIDEVGRGPLAGPVTICAFAVPVQDLKLLDAIGAKDSKQLSEQKRDVINIKLRNLAKQGHCAFQIASSSSVVIDIKGINQAISLAILSALKKMEETLEINPDHMDIYLDGGLSAGKRYFRQHTIIRGDASIPVISCASILAKVHRDALMNKYDLQSPGYDFFSNKGYGTADHFKAIRKNGFSSIHRISFLKSLG